MQPSASMKAGLTGNDKPVTNLAIGVPDIQTPPEIIDILKAGADAWKLGYGPSKGTAKALHNLKKLAFAGEESIDPDANLQLVSGAKYGIYLSLKTICNVGDTVLLMQPYWLSYPEIVTSLGLNFQSWNPVVDNAGNLDFSLIELEQLIKQYKATALMLNNPNNPSGKIFSKEWQMELNAILQKYDCWLLIDEVYRELVYDQAAVPEFTISGPNIVRVGSLSKSLSIPGLRLGYICGPKEMIDNADLFNQHIQTCINSLSSYLIENLDAGLFHSFVNKCAAIYKERFEVIERTFKGTKLKLLHSDASFYSLVDFGSYFPSGVQACDFLSSGLGIITVPGLPYGSNFDTYIRICLTLPSDVLSEKLLLILKNLNYANL